MIPDYSSVFESIFKNAKQNAIIILDEKGIMLDANPSFLTAFGYTLEELASNHYRMLFTKEDQNKLLPENEIQHVLEYGSADDENFILHKNGTPIWIMGEAIFAVTKTGNKIIKIVNSLHSLKQLKRFLIDPSDLIENVFDSVTDTALVLLDTQMTVIKVNKAFRDVFEFDGENLEGEKLSAKNNNFWQSEDIKKPLIKAIVHDQMINQIFVYERKNKKKENLFFRSKWTLNNNALEKQLLLIINKENSI